MRQPNKNPANKNPVRRKLLSSSLLLLFVATIGLLVSPAHATADKTWYVLDITPTEAGTSVSTFSVYPAPLAVSAGDVQFTANLLNGISAVSPLLVLAKFEGGPNDPDGTADSVGAAANYGSPDGSCTIDAGASTCTITLSMPLPTPSSSSKTAHDPIRFWINGRRIDTSKSTTDTTNGCIDANSDTSITNGDATDFVDTIVEPSSAHLTGTQAGDKAAFPAGATKSPATCDAAGSKYADDLPDTKPDVAGSTPAPSSAAPSSSSTPTDTTSSAPASSTPTSTASSPSATPTDTTSSTPSSTPADSSSGTPASSPSVSGPSGAIDLAASPTSAVFGTTINVSGTVTCGGVSVAHAIVDVFRRIVGQSNSTVMETESDVQGRFAVRDEELPGNADYSAVWHGNDACPAGAETGREQKRVLISVGVVANVTGYHIHSGRAVRIYGRVLPAHAGKKISLQFYRGDQHRWAWISQSKLSRESKYDFFYTSSMKGYLLFRVVYLTQDLDHEWNVSRSLKVTWG